MGWTEERVSTLKKLFIDGLSASQIARELGSVSRNAVIGKVHRLGLAGRATPSQPRQGAYRPPRAPRPVSAVPATPKTSDGAVLDVSKSREPQPRIFREEGPGSATIHTLDVRMCKWPIGDPASDSFTYCGKRTTDRKVSFCLDHARVAYQPQQQTSANELARSLRRYI